jgi:hypothetical protein
MGRWQHRRSDPPHERLDALGRVQSRLMSGLVQEKVRRATEQPPRADTKLTSTAATPQATETLMLADSRAVPGDFHGQLAML